MAMVVKNNMSAVSTLNTLNKNQSALSKSLQKVSSGMKINSAQDDASGYAISERMRVMIRSLDQANDNTQNGSSLMKVAEGAVANTVEILTTLKQKAINAATDTNTDEDRATIQKEIDQLVDQIDSNALITFNGKYLLDGSKTQRAVYNTNTAMTNEKLDVNTTGTTKLTELRSRKGELLRIQNTDEVHASFVINGKTYTTTYTVSDTTLQDIFANLNKAGKEQGLVDANGNSIDAFGPANTATKTVPAGTAANITIDSETTLIAAANDINSYDGDIAVLKADATAYLTAHSVEDSANNLADALQTFLGSQITLTPTTDGTAEDVVLKYDATGTGATAAEVFGADENSKFMTASTGKLTLNGIDNVELAAGIDNMISKLAEVADTVNGETLSSMTNTLTTMITSLANTGGTMSPEADHINLDSDTAAAVEQFALSYLSYKIANSGAAPTVSTSTTPLGNQTALDLQLDKATADHSTVGTNAAAENEYIDVINGKVTATDELKASVKAYLASGATSNSAKEEIINALVEAIGDQDFGAITATAGGTNFTLTDGGSTPVTLLEGITITSDQQTGTAFTLSTLNNWDELSATLAEKLTTLLDNQIAYGKAHDLDAAINNGGASPGTSQNLTTNIVNALTALFGGNLTLTNDDATPITKALTNNEEVLGDADVIKARTEFAKAYLAEKMDVSDKVEDNGLVAVGTQIGLDAAQNMQYTADGQTGLTVTAANSGVDYQISGLTINIKDSNGQNRTAVNEFLDAFSTTIFATNVSEDTTLKIHTGAFSNQSISVSLEDMRAQALGLKSLKNEVVRVATVDQANAAISVFNNALQKALDIQTTIGAIEARLEYTSTNLTTSSENVQSAESTIRDADMAKEMTNYTKNNVLLQAAQSMLAQANQNSSAVLSLLQ